MVKYIYVEENRDTLTANNSQIIWDETVKSDLRQRTRLGTTQIMANRNFRAPSMWTPALDDDLIKGKAIPY